VHSAQNANILGARISDKVLFTGTMYVPFHAKLVILCAVAVSVATTFLTVRQSTKRGMTPQMTPDNPMAASQKYMAYIVPFFALSGLYWAFGLVLYWVTTNVWTLGQQYVLFKKFPPPEPAGAAAGGGTGAPAKPAPVIKPSAARSLTRPKPSAPASPPATGGGAASAPPGKGRPRTSPGQGQAQRKNPQASPAGQPTSSNGSGSGSSILKRLGRGRPEPEPQPEAPEVKLIRQQRPRQSRSKRSGKR
jgi:YidC/Oxa1 family membrane protein insertase